jgi:hypothetical protein
VAFGRPDIGSKNVDAGATGLRDELGVESAAIDQVPGFHLGTPLVATAVPPQLDLGGWARARRIEDVSGIDERELLRHAGRQAFAAVAAR